MTSHDEQDTLFDVPVVPYVLTVRQPWAWAIIHAGKDVENRSRNVLYRGPLLIHAAARRYDRFAADFLTGLGVEIPDDLPQGQLVGQVDLVGSVQDSDSRWAIDGEWHWLLANAQPVTRPLPMLGQLQMFRAPENWAEAFAG